MPADINIKTVLLGSSKAGKTSLVRRFVENTFIDSDDFVSVSNPQTLLHPSIIPFIHEKAYLKTIFLFFRQLVELSSLKKLVVLLLAEFYFVFGTLREKKSKNNLICLDFSLKGQVEIAHFRRYESVTRTFYRNANAAIVCYDVTNPKSWIRAKNWVTELRQFEEVCILLILLAF